MANWNPFGSIMQVLASLVGQDGASGVSVSNPFPTKEVDGAATQLLTNATATGSPVTGVRGGSYVWAAQATNWNGATATLEAIGPDGVTYMTIDTMTADGTKGVVIGSNASIRVRISVAVPVGVNSSIS